jgi:hypothetical protein
MTPVPYELIELRVDAVQRELNELFRIGRRPLAIGASILVACLSLVHFAGGFLTESPFKAPG